MAEYSKLYITNNGQALMAKMIAGSGNIDFTKVCSSSTQYTESQLQALTALSNIKQTTLVSKVTRTNEVAIKIDAAYSNVDLYSYIFQHRNSKFRQMLHYLYYIYSAHL